jgi:SAM-dependent methyltransferase
MPGGEASAWVCRFAPLVPSGGRVLDLAAGGGRHARLFLERGHPVLAVDRDVTGLADLAASPGCEVVETDLEDGAPWRLGGAFAGIVVTNYLHRPLLPDLIAALRPGGLLIYETFMIGNERLGKPSNPAFLLRPNELIGTFAPALQIVAFEQGEVASPRPACIQRVACVKDPAAPVRLPLAPPAAAPS